VIRLVLWEDDIVNSALALGSGLLFVILLKFENYTFISLVSYLVLLQLLVCFFYVNGMRLWIQTQGRTLTSSSDDGPKEYVTVDSVRSFFVSIVNTLNPLIAFSIFIFRCKDNLKTLKVMGIVVLSALFGRCFDSLTLFGFGYLLAFSVPKLYFSNQEIFDHHLRILTIQLVAATQLVFGGKPKKS